MMFPVYGSSVGKVPLLLLALAAGYAVLVLSQSQQRPLDVLGRFLGGLVVLVSLVGLLCVAVCSVWCGWSRCHQGGMCPSSGKPPHCGMPMTEQPPANTPAETK